MVGGENVLEIIMDSPEDSLIVNIKITDRRIV